MQKEKFHVVGAFDAVRAQEFLDASVIPLRLSTLSTNGMPLVTSLWFIRSGGSIYCASVAESKLVARLRADPRCGFEVAGDNPPYRGLRGQAVAALLPGEGAETLNALMARYLGDRSSTLRSFLLARADREVAIRLQPIWTRGWDYSERMNDAGLNAFSDG